MLDAPVEGYRSIVGAAPALAFEPLGNARNERANMSVQEVQDEIINANRANFSLVVMALGAEAHELEQAGKICPPILSSEIPITWRTRADNSMAPVEIKIVLV